MHSCVPAECTLFFNQVYILDIGLIDSRAGRTVVSRIIIGGIPNLINGKTELWGPAYTLEKHGKRAPKVRRNDPLDLFPDYS